MGELALSESLLLGWRSPQLPNADMTTNVKATRHVSLRSAESLGMSRQFPRSCLFMCNPRYCRSSGKEAQACLCRDSTAR